MRTTIRLDDDLLSQVKLHATQSGMSMAAFVEEALRESLSRRSEATRQAPVRLPTVSGQGLQPGVDLDDSAALLELMGEPVGSS